LVTQRMLTLMARATLVLLSLRPLPGEYPVFLWSSYQNYYQKSRILVKCLSFLSWDKS
jgi:hypothetical protein